MTQDAMNQNVATWLPSASKDLNNKPFRLKFLTGHTVDQCGGKCMKVFGVYLHIDCVGFGYVCNHTAASRLITTEEEEGGVDFSLALDSDDLGPFLEYPFPNRTFLITNPENNTDLWLNIPEQTLTRNDYDEPFIIHNIWFSENPELKND
jgi:hypothetical protein